MIHRSANEPQGKSEGDKESPSRSIKLDRQRAKRLFRRAAPPHGKPWGGVCMCTMGAQKSGRPMVAPTFIDGNAIGFVGAGNARQTIPQSASLTDPFTQGSLWPLRRGRSMWSGLLLVGAFGGLGFMGGRVARVVQLLVAEVDEQVRADGQQIENIHGQHIGDVM